MGRDNNGNIGIVYGQGTAKQHFKRYDELDPDYKHDMFGKSHEAMQQMGTVCLTHNATLSL